MSIVVCKLPDAGLGNQLFPLAKALVFAHLNNLKLIVTGYHRIKAGPYLRGEKNKRKYKDFFSFQKGIGGEWIDRLRVKKYIKRMGVINEPSLHHTLLRDEKVYYFSNLSHYSDYFNELKDHRELAIRLLKEAIRPSLIAGLEKLEPPEIAVHIRMGDFRKLKANEDFNKVGSVRTPADYFIEMIETIRTISGKCIPVQVFTDGHANELQNLIALPETRIVEGNNDITDLLLMSKSKVIITSAGSTFSYWAGYFSDAILLMHPGHIHSSVRPGTINKLQFEGALVREDMAPLLVQNLKAL